jgi:aspartyl-tRNA(Asn)/glutamyl-tRNA(Gln) amidotransferase subunit A
MEHLLRDVEVVATPTVGVPAPEILPGEPTVPEAARRNFVAFTFLMNFTGLPAVSVPTGLVDGRPAGLQLIGREGSERLLLDLARTYQKRIFRLPASTFAQQHTSAIGGTR